MTFSMTASKSSIEKFYDFAKKGTSWCRGHIIAKPNKPAYLHHQHVEINLDVWRELGRSFIFEKWKNYERSDKKLS